MVISKKLSELKSYIELNRNYEGEFWLYAGNSDIHNILDTFSEIEWNELKNDLVNWKDYEHSIFSRAILDYDTDRRVTIVDVYEIFFTEFTLLTDLDDADCLLQDIIIYIPSLKEPKIELLEKVADKIEVLKNYNTNPVIEKSYDEAKQLVKDYINKIPFR